MLGRKKRKKAVKKRKAIRRKVAGKVGTKRQRSSRRKKILKAIRLAKTDGNRGLLRRAIFNLPNSPNTRIEEGLYGSIFITMDDGWEARGYGLFLDDCAKQVLDQYAWRMWRRGLI